MKAHAVGSIVESICGKCNDVMGHTIMAMVGNEIIKVECRVCKSVHKYRPPVHVAQGKSTVTMKKGRDGEPVSSRQDAVKQAARPAAPRPARKVSAAASAAQALLDAWRVAMSKHQGEEARPYAMNERFEPGEFIMHPTFGPGVVSALQPPDKMDVLFEIGVKRLLCNKV
ncbi:MAG: hypothetical protein DELT_02830 [Desulfovibrio sp.]